MASTSSPSTGPHPPLHCLCLFRLGLAPAEVSGLHTRVTERRASREPSRRKAGEKSQLQDFLISPQRRGRPRRSCHRRPLPRLCHIHRCQNPPRSPQQRRLPPPRSWSRTLEGLHASAWGATPLGTRGGQDTGVNSLLRSAWKRSFTLSESGTERGGRQPPPSLLPTPGLGQRRTVFQSTSWHCPAAGNASWKPCAHCSNSTKLTGKPHSPG